MEDTESPVLVPLDDREILEVEGGTRFDDRFAVADDILDGDLTWNVFVDVTRRTNLVTKLQCCQFWGAECRRKVTGCESDRGRVETRAPAGTKFLFKYGVRDRASNNDPLKQLLREVTIVDNTPPVVFLEGENTDQPYQTERECYICSSRVVVLSLLACCII